MPGLPSVVINRIVYFATGEVHNSLSDWKSALLLLLISREWRYAAKRILYRHAFLELVYKEVSAEEVTGMYFSEQNKLLTANTNILLIERNGSSAMASRLVIDYGDSGLRTMVLLKILTELGIESDSNSPMSIIKRWTDTVHAGQTPVNSLRFGCYKAASDAALLVARKLPNITRLIFATSCVEANFCKFVNTLTDSYIDQLIEFYSELPPNRSTNLTSKTLAHVSIQLRSHTIVSIPKFNPQPLKHFHLSLKRELFRWDLFRHTNVSDVISFDNLETLMLFYPDLLFAAAQQLGPNSNIPELLFPRLANLVLHYIPLTTNEVKHLMKAPLKYLEYSGCLDTALLMCSQNISGLDELLLTINVFIVHLLPDDIVGKLNQIFSKTAGISRVSLDFHWRSDNMSFDDVDWIHLTQLYIHGSYDLYDLLLAIPRMPNVVELTAVATYVTQEDFMLVLSCLKQSKESMATSKLKHLKIPNLAIVDYDQVFDELRQCLPELEVVSCG